MSPRAAALAAAAAVAVWLGSWALLHHAWWGGPEIVDTPVYEHYGDAMRAGSLPYRDFDLEYPPAALPVFLAPELTARAGSFDEYDASFERWMAGLGAAMVVLVGLALVPLRPTAGSAAAAVGFVAVSPLLLGSVFLTRFDLWPATLAVGALAALLWELDLVAAAVLGVAVAAKLWPAVLVPLGVAWVWRRRGRRAAAVWTGTLAAVLAAIVLPFAILSPGGVAHSLSTQLTRPLQIESLGSAVLLAAHHLGGLRVGVHTDHGSQNLVASGSTTVSAVSSALQLAALLVVWIAFARGPATRARLVLAAAAAATVFVAFGKVFSPQFLIWLVPLVPLVRGRRGLVASALLAAALVLTQLWFPGRYWNLVAFGPYESWVLLARDAVVVALAVLLVAGLVGGYTAVAGAAESSHSVSSSSSAGVSVLSGARTAGPTGTPRRPSTSFAAAWKGKRWSAARTGPSSASPVRTASTTSSG
jgi:hypothetical protein